MKAGLILNALPVILVSACSASGAPPGDRSSAPAELQHIVWQVTERSGSPAHRKSPLTLAFGPHKFRGGFNCNSIFGENAFPSPGRIDLSRFSQTLVACDDKRLMEQDGYYDRMIRKMTAYRLESDGSLLLTAPDGDSIRLHRGAVFGRAGWDPDDVPAHGKGR